MHTNSKSPETQAAQMAAYAVERVEDHSERTRIFDNLGARALRSVEGPFDADLGVENDREAELLPIESNTEYTDFLRSVGGSRYEAIQVRAELLSAYESFAPTVVAVKTELDELKDTKQHPAYLGSGGNSRVFAIDQGGERYAVRMPAMNSIRTSVIDSHLASAVRAKGVSHLEQIVAASYEDGVTVAEIMPGVEMDDLTVEDVVRIRDEQVGQLVDTAIVAHERGISIDPKSSNIFYDTEAGYGIIDYLAAKTTHGEASERELGKMIGSLAVAIRSAGLQDRAYGVDKTVGEYVHEQALQRANLRVLTSYRAEVLNRLSGHAQDEALQLIDTTLSSLGQSIDDYDNPAWVAEHMQWQQESKRRSDELRRKQQEATLAGKGPVGWGAI